MNENLAMPRHARNDGVLSQRVITPGKDTTDYTPDEVEFMMAMDCYKRFVDFRPLDCRDILIVAKSLGYRKEG